MLERLDHLRKDTRCIRVLERIAVLVFGDTRSGANVSRILGSGRHVVVDGDIRQHGEVGRPSRTERVKGLDRVRPDVVARLIGRGRAEEVGQDQREVVGTLRETNSRLVDERDVGNRVKTGIVGLSRVVGPFGTLDTTIDSGD